jgi:hypothetical protein
MAQVLDIEPVRGAGAVAAQGCVLAEAEVARTSDLGANDDTFTVTTHLGHLLQPVCLNVACVTWCCNVVRADCAVVMQRVLSYTIVLHTLVLQVCAPCSRYCCSRVCKCITY